MGFVCGISNSYIPAARCSAPFGDFNNPGIYKIPERAKGFGRSLTYNFDPHWGAEIDLGQNWGNSNYDPQASISPRFIWRTDSANYFLHTLVSLNRVSVSGLQNGRRHGPACQYSSIAAVRSRLCLGQAQLQWISSPPPPPCRTRSCRHASFNGVRLWRRFCI